MIKVWRSKSGLPDLIFAAAQKARSRCADAAGQLTKTIRRRKRLISIRPLTKVMICAAIGLYFTCALPVSGEPGPSVRDEDGKYFDKDDTPTYNIKEDGTVDWYTYSGFRRYHSECHVCHGPDGEGSSYAPGLKDSLKTMGYQQFLEIVASGRKDVNAAQNLVMPALGSNKSVMCFIDDMYVYLKARSDDVLPRGRPAKRADKPESATKYEKECL
jgi:methanol metabolism-related c-type cytochrome